MIGELLEKEGQARAEQIGPSATYVHFDVADPDDWSAAVATAIGRYGKLDVLVNNAGIAQAAPIDEYPRADWDTILAVNLTGVRVNSVHPGFISTPMTAAVPPDASVVALGRPGAPEEVAKLVVFLASDESSFSNGGSPSATLGRNGVLSKAV